MKYLNKVSFVILAAGFLASCSETQESMESRQEIVVKTNISQMTKAPALDENGSGQFTPGDEFSIHVTADNNNNQLPYIWGTTELKWNQIIKENPAVTSAYFSANYPSITTETPQAATFDVATATNPDLLLAPKVYLEKKTGNPLNLSFQHAMHMLRVTYVAQGVLTQEDIQNTQTSCTALSTCSLNLLEGTLTQVATDSRKEWTSQSGTEVFFIIPPQGTQNVSLKITTQGIQKEVSLTELLENGGSPITDLKGGKRFDIKLSISESGIKIEDSQISGWENQGSVEGELSQNEGTTLRFCGNGASGEMASITGKAGETIKLPECGFEYEFAKFRGWGKSYDDLYPLAPGSDFVLPEQNTTLYARWEIDLTQGGATPEFANTIQWVKGITPPKDSEWEPINGLGEEYKSVVWKKEYGWYDTYQGDRLLCWAATASNIIHWWLDQNKKYIDQYHKGYSGPSGYDGRYQTSEIFKYFEKRWPDQGNFATAGFSWFIAGTSEQYPGGGFFKEVFAGKDIYTKKTIKSRRVWNEVFRDAFQNGKGLSYITPDLGYTHQCTIWGVGYDSEGFANCLYYTNSNDGRMYTPSGLTGLMKLEFAGYENGNGAPLIESSIPGRYFTLISVESYSLGQDIWEEYLKNQKTNRN